MDFPPIIITIVCFLGTISKTISTKCGPRKQTLIVGICFLLVSRQTDSNTTNRESMTIMVTLKHAIEVQFLNFSSMMNINGTLVEKNTLAGEIFLLLKRCEEKFP